MFNTISPKTVNSIKIQACSGGIYKSHPKSRFVNANVNSGLVDSMLPTSPFSEPSMRGKPVVVLQVVNTVNDCVLIEYMFKEDYEAENIYFDQNGSQIKK